ncbi:unnamed protein product, partial [Didymodactylos carnosus]
DDRSLLDDNSGDDDTDVEDSELPDGLKTGSENSETGATDEDDWQEETDVSSVESESNSGGDQEPPRRRSKVDQRSESEVFLSKSGRLKHFISVER